MRAVDGLIALRDRIDAALDLIARLADAGVLPAPDAGPPADPSAELLDALFAACSVDSFYGSKEPLKDVITPAATQSQPSTFTPMAKVSLPNARNAPLGAMALNPSGFRAHLADCDRRLRKRVKREFAFFSLGTREEPPKILSAPSEAATKSVRILLPYREERNQKHAIFNTLNAGPPV